MQRSSLRKIVAELEAAYGPVKHPRNANWFELVLLENVAYLVDDARRAEVFKRLKREIGITPEKILRADLDAIADVIADGGMKPRMRAEKVRACAEIAVSIGKLAITKQVLQRFPGIGEPSADKILLFCAGAPSVAPDSNALRVLTRLGFVEEKKNYSATYRAAIAATSAEIKKVADAQSAHIALRRHGQEICKRSSPRCDVCAVRAACAWYQRFSA